MMYNGKLYADNFHERARACKDLASWTCKKCHRKHGEECTPDTIQLSLKGHMKKRKKKKIVVVAHHVNYDTENPDAELIILCRACHGKAQKQHNKEMGIKNTIKKEKQEIENEIKGQINAGQLSFDFEENEYPVVSVDFPIKSFFQS